MISLCVFITWLEYRFLKFKKLFIVVADKGVSHIPFKSNYDLVKLVRIKPFRIAHLDKRKLK